MPGERLFKLASSKAAGEGKTGGVPFTPPAPSCRAAPSPRGYVEDFAKPRTKLEAGFNISQWRKWRMRRDNHRQSLFICGFDNFSIANRAARLNDRGDPRLRRGIESIPEREERIRRHDATLDRHWAFITASLTESTRLIWPAPIPTICPDVHKQSHSTSRVYRPSRQMRRPHIPHPSASARSER